MRQEKTTVPGRHAPTIDYFRTVAWVLALLYLFLALFALVSGRIMGFDNVFPVCLLVGTVTTAIFAAIIALNLLVVGVIAIVRHCRGRRRMFTR